MRLVIWIFTSAIRAKLYRKPLVLKTEPQDIADPPILSSRPRNGTVVFSLFFANAALKFLPWP